jgi:tRNA(Ile)-lysidine synthase
MTAGLNQQVARFCQKHRLLAPDDSVVVAVSGGPDSLCLLHLLTTLAPEFGLTLIVAHLNHGLRGPAAQADETFVCDLAAAWGLPVQSESCNVPVLAAAHKLSVEEAARQARYAFLWRVAVAAGAAKIAVGHHADDQAETVLMHLLRGAGLAGLRGILPAVPVAGLRLPPALTPPPGHVTPQIIRPLLNTSRADIEAYCRDHGLQFRQDASNQDTTYFRNRLRHELLPYLESYNPGIRRILQRMAQVAAAEADLLNTMLAEAWPGVVLNETAEQIEFKRSAWLKLPPALQRSTLRRAVERLRHSLRDLSFEHIESALDLIHAGQTGSQATLLQGLQVNLAYDAFTVGEVNPAPAFTTPYLLPGQTLPVQLPGLTPLPECGWRLRATLLSPAQTPPERLAAAGPWEVYLDAAVVGPQPVLRTRQPGDLFCPFGLGGHQKKVNEFMIDQKIPAARRGHMPLLAANDRVLWVCGYRPDERGRVTAASRQVIHFIFEKQVGLTQLAR